MNRRKFLKNTAGAAAGTMVLPSILPACSKGANDRIQVAHIGVGSRGTATTKSYFLNIPDSRSVAACDAFKDRREGLAAQITDFYKKKYGETVNCTPYLDFEAVLERPDIDAVHISSGDYWHLPMAIKAARAGKHIYLEKPLGLNLDNMLALEKVMNEKGLVFHYGTQQRSLEHIRIGVEMIRNGEIGPLEKIEIWAPPGLDKPQGSDISEAPPAGLDYDRWLGPAPEKPYCQARVARTGIYHISDYAIGFIAGWGAHPLDVAVFGAKEQMLGAAECTCTGSFFPEEILFDTIWSWDMNILYETGLKIHFVSTNNAAGMRKKLDHGNGTTFYGTKGWISLGRSAVASNIPELDKKLNETVYGENNLHGLNFIKAIQGRIDPLAPLEDAIISDCISHMGNILVRSGRDRLTWDPVKKEITSEPGLVRQFFHRDLRDPYII